MPNLEYVQMLSQVVLDYLDNKKQKNAMRLQEVKKIMDFLCKAVGYKQENKEIELVLKDLVTGVNIGKKAINNDKLHDKLLNYLEIMPDNFSLFSKNTLKENLIEVINNPMFEKTKLLEMYLSDLKHEVKEYLPKKYLIELECDTDYSDTLFNVVMNYKEKLGEALSKGKTLHDIEVVRKIIFETRAGSHYKVMDTKGNFSYYSSLKPLILDNVKLQKSLIECLQDISNSEFKKVVLEVVNARLYTYENLIKVDIKNHKNYIKAVKQVEKEVLSKQDNENEIPKKLLMQPLAQPKKKEEHKVDQEKVPELSLAPVPIEQQVENVRRYGSNYNDVMAELSDFFKRGAKLHSPKKMLPDIAQASVSVSRVASKFVVSNSVPKLRK